MAAPGRGGGRMGRGGMTINEKIKFNIILYLTEVNLCVDTLSSKFYRYP